MILLLSKIKKRKEMAKLKIIDVKMGDKFKMKNNTYHNYGLNIGDVVIDSGQRNNGANIYSNEYNTWIPLTILERFEMTITALQERVDKLKVELAEEQAKIDWMVKTGETEYDETEFKVWNTLQTLNSSSTDKEKAKIIAQLIKK